MGMALQMKPGYVNPLTMRSPNTFTAGKNGLSGKDSDGKIKFKDLKIRQQQLQNELLLVKATGTDSGSNSLEKVKKMEEKLANVNVDLHSAKLERMMAKAEEVMEQELQNSEENGMEALKNPQMDTYEHGVRFKESLGIYGKNRRMISG